MHIRAAGDAAAGRKRARPPLPRRRLLRAAALLIALAVAACDAGALNDDCDMPDSSCPNQERDTM